ncbi:hypothetical protein FALCPG4_002280 [Fusarium falciforme]
MSCSCGNNTTRPNGSSSEKPTDVEMQAVTAILNPDTTARDAKVIVFQSPPNRTLGFEQGYYEAPYPYAPVLKAKSNHVSMVYDDIVHVYSVSADSKTICLLSPVFMPLKKAGVAELKGKISGCSNGKDQGWIYFQKQVFLSSGFLREGDNYYIYEKNLSNPEEDPIRVSKTNNSMENTDLVALYDGNYRWIAYQTKSDGDDEDSEIKVIRLGPSATGHFIAHSSKYLDNKLAEFSAAYSNKDSKEMIHLYFRGRGNLLYRSSSEVTGGRANFSKPYSLPGPVKLAPFTSLSVVPSPKPDQKLNVIYAFKWGGKGQVTVFEDKWV